MSHTTTIGNVAINDVDALRTATARLQEQGVSCELVENVKPRMFYASQHGVCDYVLRLNDSQYDVGFEKQKDGTYAPVFDAWAGEVHRNVGATGPACSLPENRARANIGKLMHEYSVAAATNAAQQQGYLVENTVDAEGRTQLRVTGM